MFEWFLVCRVGRAPYGGGHVAGPGVRGGVAAAVLPGVAVAPHLPGGDPAGVEEGGREVAVSQGHRVCRLQCSRPTKGCE